MSDPRNSWKSQGRQKGQSDCLVDNIQDWTYESDGEPSVDADGREEASVVPVEPRLVVGREPLLLGVRSDDRQPIERLPEPGEDRRSTSRIEPLELSRGGQVVSHDGPVDHPNGDDAQQDDRRSEADDGDDSSDAREGAEETGEGPDEDFVDHVDVSGCEGEDKGLS